jgi:hypothetical protein
MVLAFELVTLASIVCVYAFPVEGLVATLYDLSALCQAIMVLSALRIARQCEQPMWIWLLFWPLVVGSWLLFAERFWEEALHYKLVATLGDTFFHLNSMTEATVFLSYLSTALACFSFKSEGMGRMFKRWGFYCIFFCLFTFAGTMFIWGEIGIRIVSIPAFFPLALLNYHMWKVGPDGDELEAEVERIGEPEEDDIN